MRAAPQVPVCLKARCSVPAASIVTPTPTQRVCLYPHAFHPHLACKNHQETPKFPSISITIMNSSQIPPISQPDELQSVTMDSTYQLRNPSDNNAALWVKNLPPGCTIHQLIRAIISVGPTGRILFSKIVPPSRPGQQWAAKVVFATREEAQRLRGLAQKNEFVMEGRRIWADWHRFFSSSFLALEPITRVLVVEGPINIVNIQNLDQMFKRQLKRFDTEAVTFRELPAAADGMRRASVVWRFGSWYDQAETAAQQLEAKYPGIVEVRYGLDPCASPAPGDFLP